MMDRVLKQSHRDWRHLLWDGPLSVKTPVTRVPGFRELIAVRRIVLLERGPVQPHILAVGCGHPLCVDPRHVRGRTRAELAKITAKTSDYHQNPIRNAKIAAKARRIFTPEQAREIALDPRPQRVIAKELGVTQSTIGSIKMGKTYRFVSNPFAGLFRSSQPN